jgi:hypothetical protein
MKRRNWSRRASVPDRTVRIMRALRDVHGWTYQHIADHLQLNIWMIVSCVACRSRNGAGAPGRAELLEAKLIDQTWKLQRGIACEARALSVLTIPRTDAPIGSPLCQHEP